MNFFKILTLTILALSASLAFGEDKPAVKSPTDVLYEKVVAENTRDTIKAYDLYCKQLAEASARVAKSLEGIKADLNNTKKFTNLSITERADMMKEIDEKIKSVDEGAIGDGIVAKKGQEGDLLGEGKGDLAKGSQSIAGVWSVSGTPLTFTKEGTWSSPWDNFGGIWKVKGKQVIMISNKGNNGTFLVLMKDGESWSLPGNLGGFGGGKAQKLSD